MPVPATTAAAPVSTHGSSFGPCGLATTSADGVAAAGTDFFEEITGGGAVSAAIFASSARRFSSFRRASSSSAWRASASLRSSSSCCAWIGASSFSTTARSASKSRCTFGETFIGSFAFGFRSRPARNAAAASSLRPRSLRIVPS